MRLITLLLLIYSHSVMSQDFEDQEFKYQNSNTGALDIVANPKDDHSRFSLNYRGDLSVSSFANMQIVSATYGFRIGKPWFEFLFSQESGEFLSFAENSQAISSENADAEGNFERTEGDTITKRTYGVGLSYRYHTSGDLLGIDKLFDLTSVYLTYNQLADSKRGLDYSGAGLLVSYLLNYRYGKSVEFGPLFSYEIASLRREKIGAEPTNERAILISNMTMGLNLSIYWGE